MSRTYKLSAIYFISISWVVAVRILMNFLQLSDNWSSWLFTLLVQVVGLGLIPMLLYKQWIKGDIIAGFHLKVKTNPVNYLIAIAIGFLLYYVTTGISIIYQTVLIFLGFTHVSTAPGTIFSGPEVLILEFLTVAVLPAIFEELTNRGLLLSVFEKEENDNKVIVIMAVIFALFHQNIVQTGYTFIGGLVFAFLAIKTKSIVPGIIIHFINNGLSVLFSYAEQKGLALAMYRSMIFNMNIFLLFGTWITAGFIIFWLLKVVKKINGKVVYSEPQASTLNNDRLYSLFGFAPAKPAEKKPAISDYGWIIAACTLSFALTVFTFMWGLWR